MQITLQEPSRQHPRPRRTELHHVAGDSRRIRETARIDDIVSIHRQAAHAVVCRYGVSFIPGSGEGIPGLPLAGFQHRLVKSQIIDIQPELVPPEREEERGALLTGIGSQFEAPSGSQPAEA